jgi:hypothetical protein
VAIDIQTPSKKNFFLFFDDAEMRDAWLTALRTCIDETRYRADFAHMAALPGAGGLARSHNTGHGRGETHTRSSTDSVTLLLPRCVASDNHTHTPEVSVTVEVGVLCDRPYPEPATRTPSPAAEALAVSALGRRSADTCPSSRQEAPAPSLELLSKPASMSRIQRQKSDWWQSLVARNPAKAKKMIRDGMLEVAHRPAVWKAFASVRTRQLREARDPHLYRTLVDRVSENPSLVGRARQLVAVCSLVRMCVHE